MRTMGAIFPHEDHQAELRGGESLRDWREEPEGGLLERADNVL